MGTFPNKATQFKPGQASHGGRPGLPAEVRKARKENFVALVKMVTARLSMTQEEAAIRDSGPELPMLEVAIARCIERACEGDLFALKYLIECMVGKIPEAETEATTEEHAWVIEKWEQAKHDAKRSVPDTDSVVAEGVPKNPEGIQP